MEDTNFDLNSLQGSFGKEKDPLLATEVVFSSFHFKISNTFLQKHCAWWLNISDSVCPTDQEQLDKEINELRKGLKAKVNHLNEIQGMESICSGGHV